MNVLAIALGCGNAVVIAAIFRDFTSVDIPALNEIRACAGSLSMLVAYGFAQSPVLGADSIAARAQRLSKQFPDTYLLPHLTGTKRFTLDGLVRGYHGYKAIVAPAHAQPPGTMLGSADLVRSPEFAPFLSFVVQLYSLLGESVSSLNNPISGFGAKMASLLPYLDPANNGFALAARVAADLQASLEAFDGDRNHWFHTCLASGHSTPQPVLKVVSPETDDSRKHLRLAYDNHEAMQFVQQMGVVVGPAAPQQMWSPGGGPGGAWGSRTSARGDAWGDGQARGGCGGSGGGGGLGGEAQHARTPSASSAFSRRAIFGSKPSTDCCVDETFNTVTFGQAVYSLSALRERWAKISQAPLRNSVIGALITRVPGERACLARLPRDTDEVEAENALYFWEQAWGEEALIERDFGRPARN
jgi:hypothetical protein